MPWDQTWRQYQDLSLGRENFRSLRDFCWKKVSNIYKVNTDRFFSYDTLQMRWLFRDSLKQLRYYSLCFNIYVWALNWKFCLLILFINNFSLLILCLSCQKCINFCLIQTMIFSPLNCYGWSGNRQRFTASSNCCKGADIRTIQKQIKHWIADKTRG